MDLEKKPGSADGKRSKGTRRNKGNVDKKRDTITKIRTGVG